MKEKLLWFIGGGIVFFLLFSLLGGLYTITPPNGPVDAAYKMNRLTGKVWMIKTYTKQVGPIRVLAARQAEVEKTKELTESDIPAVAMETPLLSERQRK
ncbi:MAG: hypothetical protein ACREQA_00135 [Candidatus Binatia bacterium]